MGFILSGIIGSYRFIGLKSDFPEYLSGLGIKKKKILQDPFLESLLHPTALLLTIFVLKFSAVR